MNTAKNIKHLPGITVGSDMRDYSKDPYLMKKAERARAVIAKHGLPKEIKPKKIK